MSQYRFLTDHSIGGFYYQAGTTAFTADVIGGSLPAGWVPSGGVDPLDAGALAAFYAAGPQGPLVPSRTQFTGINVVPPTTRWTPVIGTASPNRLYQLTGLGAALAPKLGIS
jgi:hypothetical protein